MRKFALFITTAALLSGCAGYRLGSTLPAGISRVYVPTVINATSEPLLETELTSALQHEIMTRNALHLANRDAADAKLEVRVTDYRLSSIGFASTDSDSSSAREYRVWMTADAVLRNLQTGEIIAESVGVRGKTTFLMADENAQGDLVGAKRGSQAEACQNLAREIADAVTEFWE